MAGARYYKFNMELPMLWVKFQGYDNDKLAEIILSKGDEQDRKTNVKANMTKWRLDLEHKEVGNLADETIKLAKDIRKTLVESMNMLLVLVGVQFILKVIGQIYTPTGLAFIVGVIMSKHQREVLL